MKTKKLPAFVRHPLLVAFFQSRPGRILSNWVVQGMLYMNPVEIAYKITLDLLLTGAWWAATVRANTLGGWLLAWLLAHTTNWIVNGQPIAMCRHLDWGRNDPHVFVAFIEGLERRVCAQPFIAGAASFGSLSRGAYKETSDIDIRVVLRPALGARLRAAHFCFVERLRAFLWRFPLDLYAFDIDELRRKMSPKEVPVIFHDPDGLLADAYSERIGFEQFRPVLRRAVLGESMP